MANNHSTGRTTPKTISVRLVTLLVLVLGSNGEYDLWFTLLQARPQFYHSFPNIPH